MIKSKSIVLFDGECNFCNYWVQFIIKRDKKDQFRFASLQSEVGKQLLKQHNLKSDLSTVVLIQSNSKKIKSSAALHILKKIGGIYSLAILFIIVPEFIRDGVYDVIANYRTKLMPTTCDLAYVNKHQNKFL